MREALRGLAHARAHERVGLARARRRRGARRARSSSRAALEAGGERLHHPRAALDVARHRPGVVEARREREAALERDEPVGRLQPDGAAAGRRDPDRPARVGAERRVGEPGGERGGGPAATSRPRSARARPGSERCRSAGSRRSCRRRTRAGSPCRRWRTRRPRAARTASAVRSGTCEANMIDPYVVVSPAVSKRSLTASRMPEARPSGSRQEDAVRAHAPHFTASGTCSRGASIARETRQLSEA